ncbi:MAG TPA: sugar ABC transporter permease, partial [Thermodesulfobacteriota bacterium]|nr:sugar ABC transporter permease [Thermodesulfobacteriota bacterium]
MSRVSSALEGEYRRLYLPGIVVVVVLCVVPIILLLTMSFHRLSLGMPWFSAEFAGLKNWVWLFTNPNQALFKALGRTFVFCFGSVFAELFLGLAMASLLNRGIRGANFMATVFIIPTVLTPAMVGMVWRLYFTDNSIIDYLFNLFFGLDINWMSLQMAMVSLISVSVWQYTPFWVITLYAAMRLLPRAPFEAAVVDGASEWQRYRHILLPGVFPILRLLLILRIIQNFIGFDMIYSLTGGGPGTVTELLSIYIYRLNFYNKAVGPGASSSFFLI